ncbi:hypothetical protein E2562_009633, partial [Oryza meyeriana var. granulata]
FIYLTKVETSFRFIYLTQNNMQLPLQPKGDLNVLPWFHCGKGTKGQQPTMLPEDLR